MTTLSLPEIDVQALQAQDRNLPKGAPPRFAKATTVNIVPMPVGGCLFVYSPDHAQVLGPYTMDDNAEHGQLWTPTVDGEEVVIEVSLPKDEVSRMQLVLGSINQGYKK